MYCGQELLIVAAKDIERHGATYWSERLAHIAPSSSKASVAIAQQKLAELCAINGGLSREELLHYIADVEGVISQAGTRQGVIRPQPFETPPTQPITRSGLRLIK